MENSNDFSTKQGRCLRLHPVPSANEPLMSQAFDPVEEVNRGSRSIIARTIRTAVRNCCSRSAQAACRPGLVTSNWSTAWLTVSMIASDSQALHADPASRHRLPRTISVRARSPVEEGLWRFRTGPASTGTTARRNRHRGSRRAVVCQCKSYQHASPALAAARPPATILGRFSRPDSRVGPRADTRQSGLHGHKTADKIAASTTDRFRHGFTVMRPVAGREPHQNDVIRMRSTCGRKPADIPVHRQKNVLLPKDRFDRPLAAGPRRKTGDRQPLMPGARQHPNHGRAATTAGGEPHDRSCVERPSRPRGQGSLRGRRSRPPGQGP